MALPDGPSIPIAGIIPDWQSPETRISLSQNYQRSSAWIWRYETQKATHTNGIFLTTEPRQTHNDTLALQQVRQALAKLRDKQREVVEMHHGLTDTGAMRFVDIAEALSISPEMTRNRYVHAIAHVRKVLSLGSVQDGKTT